LPAEREKREWRAYSTQAQRPAVREQSRESIKDRPVFYSIIATAGGWRLAAGDSRLAAAALAVRGSRFGIRDSGFGIRDSGFGID
jgi:hypothetical protein